MRGVTVPIYVYKCLHCGAERELFRSVTEMDEPVWCDAEECRPKRRKGAPMRRAIMRRIPTLAAKQFPGANRW